MPKNREMISLVYRGKSLKKGYQQCRNEPCFCGSGKKYKKCCGFKKSMAEFDAMIAAHKKFKADNKGAPYDQH